MSPAASHFDILIDHERSSTPQLTLDLPAPPASAETPLVPVRMVNEWIYCPRLAFLEWVDGEWADTADTEEGRRAHVRVDAGGGKLPAPADIESMPDFVARSVTLASERLGIIAKIDLVDGSDGTVTPVDTKKGKRPHVAEAAYEPERVQVCAGIDPGGCWLQGGRGRDLVRRLARARAHHPRRRAQSENARRHFRAAPCRCRRAHAAAARR